MGTRLRTLGVGLAVLVLLAPRPVIGQSTSGRTEAELQAAITSQPSELTAYLELAGLYRRAGRRDDAEQVLRQALKLHPGSATVYATLTTLYNFKHEAEALLALSVEWTAASPNDSKPLLLAAQVHMIQAAIVRGQPDELTHVDRAMAVLNDARQLSPEDLTARAMWLAMLKQRIPLTEDPLERERLSQELEAGAREFAVASRTDGIASSALVAAPSPSTPFPANAVRVGGNVKPPAKTKNIDPIWPPAAQQARVQGVVILEILIDEAGKVANGRVLRSIPLLDQAAIDAVRQWEFEPTVLDGTPVPVILTATVQFRIAP
jgi:protein TonB